MGYPRPVILQNGVLYTICRMGYYPSILQNGVLFTICKMGYPAVLQNGVPYTKLPR